MDIQAQQFPTSGKREGLNSDDPEWSSFFYEKSSLLEALEPDRIEAVRSYQVFNYQTMNSQLRRGEISSQHENSIKDIDFLFDNYEQELPDGTFLYRAVELPYSAQQSTAPLEYAQNMYKPGDSFTERAYVSTSADSDFMLNFGRPKYKDRPVIIYEILAKRGLPIFQGQIPAPGKEEGWDSIQDYEREVLLRRDTEFIVAGVKEVTFRHTYFKAPHFLHRFPKAKKFTVVQVLQA